MNAQELCSNAKCIWSEDECAPDAERLDAAWRRLFGEDRPKESLAFHDGGDCMIFVYPHGRIAQVGPPRAGWTEIRTYEE